MFQRGPIFHHLVLADEINRAPAKVQSALLEAMAERQVSIGRSTYALPPLFLVMATQNPIEQEGTYPLPEAQLDRFLMHVKIGYPDASVERRILQQARGEALSGEAQPEQRVSQQAIFAARREILGLYMADAVEEYLVQLIMATRHPARFDAELGEWIAWGASPRGSIALDRCARAHAWLAGRDFRQSRGHPGGAVRRAAPPGHPVLRGGGRRRRPGPRGAAHPRRGRRGLRRRHACRTAGPRRHRRPQRAAGDASPPRRAAAVLRRPGRRSPLVGLHHSKLRGRGVDFDQVRVYQAGDDVRNIDWRVTARTQEPHTKLFHEERERPVFLLVEQSPQLFFGSGLCFKSVLAAQVAALFGWAALAHNDRIGGLVFNAAQCSEVRPRRSKQSLLQLLGLLVRANQALAGTPASAESAGSGLALALRRAREVLRPGSLALAVCDERSLDDGAELQLGLLARHCDLILLPVSDPLDHALPAAGLLRSPTVTRVWSWTAAMPPCARPGTRAARSAPSAGNAWPSAWASCCCR